MLDETIIVTATNSAERPALREPDMMQRVGLRVRALRAEMSMPRRVLSENSGVSPRYLAKLEAGNGNVSIGVLAKVARALDAPIDALIAEGFPDDTSFARMMKLYLEASPITRAKIAQILSPEFEKSQKLSRICLVGLRGAGKSTLGARVADAWRVPFVELNTEMENDAGMPIGELIAMFGQDGYRRLEAETLNRIIGEYPRAVVAVAGGIVANGDTFQTVLSRFHTIWLKASSGEHMDRVRAQGDRRPMDGNPNAMIQLRQILKERESLYAQADYALDTSGKSVEHSQSDLSKIIQENALLGLHTV